MPWLMPCFRQTGCVRTRAHELMVTASVQPCMLQIVSAPSVSAAADTTAQADVQHTFRGLAAEDVQISKLNGMQSLRHVLDTDITETGVGCCCLAQHPCINIHIRHAWPWPSCLTRKSVSR